jgi:hypothetical protein
MLQEKMFFWENGFLELTDTELRSVWGGSHFRFNPFANNFNNNTFGTSGVIQIASASGYASRINTLTFTGENSTNAYGNGGTATNNYNYSVGYFPG